MPIEIHLAVSALHLTFSKCLYLKYTFKGSIIIAEINIAENKIIPGINPRTYVKDVDSSYEWMLAELFCTSWSVQTLNLKAYYKKIIFLMKS